MGIVIVRAGMLECHGDHRGAVIGGPVLVKLVSSFSPEIVSIGFLIAESIRSPQREVPLDVVYRIVFVGIFIVSFGKQDSGPEIHGLSPEIREKLALEFDPLDPFCVWFDLDWRDNMIARDGDFLFFGWIDIDFLHITVHVAGRPQPVLPLPLVIVEPYDVAVSPFELCVDIDKTLDKVVGRRDVPDALEGKSE
jgi:hypothetical protein